VAFDSFPGCLNVFALGGDRGPAHLCDYSWTRATASCPVGDDDIRVLDPRHHAALAESIDHARFAIWLYGLHRLEIPTSRDDLLYFHGVHRSPSTHGRGGFID